MSNFLYGHKVGVRLEKYIRNEMVQFNRILVVSLLLLKC